METLFTPLLGGVLIGLSASLLMFTNGRIAGISGILGGVVAPVRHEWLWRALFIAGLFVGGAVIGIARPDWTAFTIDRSPVAIVVAGLLVGFGSRLGSGCTSGHGVCGLSRGSARSFVSVLTFMTTGVLMVALVRWGFGGAV